MSKMNIKTGDNVLVITGKDNGKISVVKATSPKSNKIIVEGVNISTKHQKARNTEQKSQIIKQEAAIDASNVMIICPTCNKATRVSRKIEDGKSIRVCKKCGAVLDVEKKAKTAKKATKETTTTAKKSTKKASTSSKSTEKKTTKTTKAKVDEK